MYQGLKSDLSMGCRPMVGQWSLKPLIIVRVCATQQIHLTNTNNVNAKKAKQLRQKARKLTGGLIVTTYINEPGASLQLNPLCTRAVYRQLKKKYKGKK